jgi:biopolymer transport protein ExbD
MRDASRPMRFWRALRSRPMAGSLKASDNSDELEVNHEINVTPFIDVMLVLLIIFMVAAPLSTVDVAVDLPASNAKPQARPNEPIFLTVKEDLSLAFGNDPVVRDGLKAALDGKTQGNTDERVFVRAHKTVDYGDLMEVMNLLRNAGYLKIGLVGLETLPTAGTPMPPSTGAP